ncbi:MAG: hypothetical protein LHW54_06065 [Candidatus Cloacimonetes bacterium]|jgi:hypothetical protein|nr:hypothetical protein [Candidatus Cloacimonadota bacterium]MCB5264345.1 hypothetical protein [Candidatus Cloacimonadota bacterium]MDD2315244.1 hypothetical protein [Proteiniphilum sp.]MDD3076999.1 hypothetical protein [Proteiniphilum sp.]MDD3956886.1 hypothetical protein [Proteiniphilum sp.]
MLWFFKARVIIQKPDGRLYYPKMVSASTTESTPFSNADYAEIELATNRSPYTSEYINPVENDDIVRLQISVRINSKEKAVLVDLFEGRIEAVSADYSTTNNTTLTCRGHINAAAKHLIQEDKTWNGTVEARTILAYFINSTIPRLTWSNQLPYVGSSSVSFTDTESAYSSKKDQTYLTQVFQDLEKQSGYNWKIGTKSMYTSGGLLDKVYLTWLPVSTVATEKYKAIEGTARYLGSKFVVSIENQATQYIVKGDTPSGGTQYSGTARNEAAITQYGLKTDVDVFSNLQSNATCKSIADGSISAKVGDEITGSITLIGTPEAHAGDLVYVYANSTELNGAIIEGTFNVSRVRHTISSNSYRTSLEVGGIVVDAYDLISNIKKIAVTTKCNQVT